MKHTLNILIFLLVVDLVGIGAIWYGYSSTVDIKTKESELLEELHQEGLKGQKLTELRKTLTSVGKQRDELEKFLIDPSDENQIPLLNSFERLGASTTGLTVDVSRFDFGGTPQPAIHADASLKGSWNQMYYFLRLIEEYPSRVVINKFDAYLNAPSTDANGKVIPIDRWSGAISFDLVGLKQNTH